MLQLGFHIEDSSECFVTFTVLLISIFSQKFYFPTYWVWKLRGWELWIFSKRCLLTKKKIILASMWCVMVVLDIGNEYSGEWRCLLSHVLQRIIFQQSFMHSSHSSHLLGKICCVRSFQKGTLFSWCSFQAWVEDIKKSSKMNSSSPRSHFPWGTRKSNQSQKPTIQLDF